MRLPGDELLELYAQATREVVIVAPFIKSAALARLLDVIPSQITAIKCVTRWRPEEIAAGVSDTEVFDLIQSKRGACLYIHPLLHAKFFRVDERCIIGSSNLTQRALGWALPANLELMFEVPADSQRMKEFERYLFATSFEASAQLKREMEAAADAMMESGKQSKLLSEEAFGEENDLTFPANSWLPLCPRPDCLYQIYTGKDTDRLVGWTLEAGQRDIQFLRIPSGLGHEAFYRFVAASLQQTPLVQNIYEASVKAISSEAGRDLIASGINKQHLFYSPEEHWNTVKSWLLHFLPHIYREPSGSNDLQRGTAVGEFRG